MVWTSLPCLTLFLWACLGVLVGELLQACAPWLLAAAGLAAGLLGYALWRERWVLPAAWLATVATFAAHTARVQAPPVPAGPSLGHLWSVRVVGPVQRAALAGQPVRLLFLARLEAERVAGRWQPRVGQGRLEVAANGLLGHNDVVWLRLNVRPPRPQVAPWRADPKRACRHRGHCAQLQAQSLPVRLSAGAGPRGPWAAADALRQRAGAALDAALPGPAAAVAKALALGDTASLAAAQRDAWSLAGIAHLLAVSGLHVSLWANMLGRLSRRLLPWLLLHKAEQGGLLLATAAFASVGIWGYAWLAGGQVSVLRAACMASAAQWGAAWGYGRGFAANALGLAGVTLLLQAPCALFAPAFCLSFVAVAGLLLLQRSGDPAAQDAASAGCIGGSSQAWQAWQAAASAVGVAAKLRAFARALAGTLADRLEESCAASAVTAPLVATYFGQLPVHAVWVNLLAVPWAAGVATPLALGWVLASALWAPQASLLLGLASCLRWALAPLAWLAARVAALPVTGIVVMRPPAFLCWALVAAALWAVRRGHRCRRQALRLGCAWTTLLAVSAALVGWPSVWRTDAVGGGVLRVWHLDVGHGDATLLQLPCGRFVLVDGGGALSAASASDPGRNQVAPALRALGVRRLAAVLLTHPHPDHMGGLAAVLAAWPVAQFWFAADGDRVAQVAHLSALVRRRGGQVGRPPKQLCWGGVQLDFWQPLAGEQASFNDHAVVVRLRYGGDSLLLTGDVEARAEAFLASQDVRAAVLKVPHHGSPTSSTANFLAAVQPRLAIVSCGAYNRFGFPHPQVLARLQAAGARVLDTGSHGLVSLYSAGSGWQFRCGNERAWRALDDD